MKVLIIGGGYAGVACAVRLARRARLAGRHVEIVLVNPATQFVERIRLHQQATGQTLAPRPLDALLQLAGVRLLPGVASAIDSAARSVRVGSQLLHWDRLVLAMGSATGRSQVPGADAHALTLSPADAPFVAGRLAALRPGARVLVVGGGLTGIEAATEIKEAWPQLDVHLFSAGELGRDWSAQARSHLALVSARLGLKLHVGVRVTALEPGALVASDGRWDMDLCIWTAGFVVPALARVSGLQVNAAGQVRVDPQLRSVSHPHIYAAGDQASPVCDPGHPLPMGCKSALPTGAHVADNLLRELSGEDGAAFDFALPFYCVSLGRNDGLIQWPDGDGRPLGRVLTGTKAAQWKESVCQMTWDWLQQEAEGREALRWMHTGHAPDRLPSPPSEESIP